jgi:hypothetical protein
MTEVQNNPGSLENQSLASTDVRKLQGQWVFDEEGEIVGRIADILVDAEKKPEWLIVSMGAFLHDDRLIPVFDMRPGDVGFVLSYTKDLVKSAPVVSVIDTSDDDERKLADYWCSSRTAAMPRACTLLSRS